MGAGDRAGAPRGGGRGPRRRGRGARRGPGARRAALDPDALRRWLADELARDERPREIPRFDELATFAYGKVRETRVRAASEARVAGRQSAV